jgi:hypothetical protein
MKKRFLWTVARYIYLMQYFSGNFSSVNLIEKRYILTL